MSKINLCELVYPLEHLPHPRFLLVGVAGTVACQWEHVRSCASHVTQHGGEVASLWSCPVGIELLSDPESGDCGGRGFRCRRVADPVNGCGTTITVVIVMVSSRNRRMLAVMEEKR